MHFMHPVKSREAIRQSYFGFGVRDFAVDSFEEIHKIMEETDSAADLGLFIRMALPKGSAAHDLSGKFGASFDELVELLKLARKLAARVGLCFHVGSQCMEPDAFRRAIERAGEAVQQAGIQLDVLDIGGGFPSVYPGLTPPPLEDYMAVIAKAAQAFPGKPELWCEPGRALVAESGSVIVRVELRKKDALYLNDGTYGSLFDAGTPGMLYPLKLIRAQADDSRSPQDTGSTKLMPYRFFGPTCDSLDAMKGPFWLPEDVVEGDWSEIGQLGAYGMALQTRFNGFYSDQLVVLDDEPLLSMGTGMCRAMEPTLVVA
jgi:ornithine decarboxylase